MAFGKVYRITRISWVQSRVCGESAFHIVDVSTSVIAVNRSTNCQLTFDNRNIDHGFNFIAVFTTRGAGVTGRQAGAKLIDNRLIGDQSNSTGLRASTVQGTLGSWQYLNTLHIGNVHVEVAATSSDWLLIKIERNVGRRTLRFRNRDVDRINSCTADIDFILTRATATSVNTGKILNVIFKAGHILLFKSVFCHSLNSNRNILHTGRFLSRRYHNLFQHALSYGNTSSACGHTCSNHRDHSSVYFRFTKHRFLPNVEISIYLVTGLVLRLYAADFY